MILFLPKPIFNLLAPLCICIVMWCIGFNMPTIIDKRRHVGKIDPPIVVYQHTTFADHYILYSVFNILRYVVLDKHRGNPLVKRFTDIFGCIPVSEEGKTGATRKIQEYIHAGDYTHKLAIAPEGGRRLDDDGNEVLAKFSTGAFVPLAPVQPVTIKFHYDSEYDDPTWNSINLNNNDNVASWFLWRFFSPPCNITVTLMEEEIPHEGMTPREYCDDVRSKMIYEITGNPRIFEKPNKKNEAINNNQVTSPPSPDPRPPTPDSRPLSPDLRELSPQLPELSDNTNSTDALDIRKEYLSELKEIVIDKIVSSENDNNIFSESEND